MKKTILFLTIAAGTSGLSGLSSANETLGTYNTKVTGTVLSSKACTITAPNNLTFDNFEGPDDIHSVTQGPRHAQLYTIIISGCKKGLHVSAKVVGEADTNNTSLLSTHSDAAGAAKNVAIAFYEQVATDLHPLVPLNSGHTTSRYINELGEAQIAIQADVVLSEDQKPASAGTISANANVQINFL